MRLNQVILQSALNSFFFFFFLFVFGFSLFGSEFCFVHQVITQFKEQGLNTDLYYEGNMRERYNIVPTSAITYDSWNSTISLSSCRKMCFKSSK